MPGAEPLGCRFRWLTAPRSAVVQPGPGHGGLRPPTRPPNSTAAVRPARAVTPGRPAARGHTGAGRSSSPPTRTIVSAEGRRQSVR
ncbi:DUF3037 domain-containing protein [Yinghuangia aomiensis]